MNKSCPLGCGSMNEALIEVLLHISEFPSIRPLTSVCIEHRCLHFFIHRMGLGTSAYCTGLLQGLAESMQVKCSEQRLAYKKTLHVLALVVIVAFLCYSEKPFASHD